MSARIEFTVKLNGYLGDDADFKKVFDYTKKTFLSRSDLTAHNWEHISRDLYNAIVIGEAEGVDMRVVLPAMAMHDIGFLYGARGRTHAAVGADKLDEYLQGAGVHYPSSTLEAIRSCIRTHKGSMHEQTPESLEAQVVADADMLEKLGPIGVYQSVRTFTEFNYPAEKVMARLAAMDDLTFSTAKGKEMAEQRKGFAESFATALLEAYKDYLS